MGIISVDLNIIDQLLIISSTPAKYWRKKWKYNWTVSQLFKDFRKAYNSIRSGNQLG
jgi:hypothetical protein